MVMREILQYVLFSHLLMIGVCTRCVPSICLNCMADRCGSFCSQNSSRCDQDTDVPPKCIKDFQVFINSSGSEVDEGDSVTLTCTHNLPVPVELKWMKNGVEIEGNSTTLFLEKLFPHDSGQFVCSLNSSCGSFKSAPHGVTVNNGAVLIIVICGVSALGLVVIMGLLMKYKLKRDNEKSKKRLRQRVEAAQNAGPASLTPRGL